MRLGEAQSSTNLVRVTVNLKSKEGQDVVRELVKEADVLVEN